jgi:hypothetical protein
MVRPFLLILRFLPIPFPHFVHLSLYGIRLSGCRQRRNAFTWVFEASNAYGCDVRVPERVAGSNADRHLVITASSLQYEKHVMRVDLELYSSKLHHEGGIDDSLN